MKIRKAKLSDLDYIIDCIYNIRVTEKELFSKLNPDAILADKFVKHIKEEINLDSYYIWIAKQNDEKVWMIIWKITENNSVWDYKLYSVLNYLFVWEKYRKKWYAEDLCKEFFEWAKNKWADRMTLSGMVWNDWAYNLYKKLGFKESVFMLGKDL